MMGMETNEPDKQRWQTADSSQGGSKMGRKRQTYTSRLISQMLSCLAELGVDTSSECCLERMESSAILIHESMSLSNRNYHSVQHVFDVTQNLTDPIGILAGLFHDCVYIHVDGGLSSRQNAILSDSIHTAGSHSCHLSTGYSDDELLHMVVIIFYGANFPPAVALTTSNGVNEFLSAVIAVRELAPLLAPSQLAEIACCIEATIPFRPTTDQDGSPMDRLFQRMQQVHSTLPHLLPDFSTEQRQVEAVQRAALLANEDVGNFSADDPGSFLDNTWTLLPESNEALRHEHLYTVREFAYAIYKMHGFFWNILQPSLILQNFRGVPTPADFKRRFDRAVINVQLGRKYLSAKLLGLSMLSALAELSGGDAPISLFVGDLPSRNRWSRWTDDELPSISSIADPKTFTTVPVPDCDQDVYRLLSQGRTSDSSFDTRQSPLAAYVYAYVGDEGMERMVKTHLRSFPLSSEGALRLLKCLPRPIVVHIAEYIAKNAQSRSDRILQIAKDLQKA